MYSFVAVLGLCGFAWASSSFASRGYSLEVLGLFIAVVSLVVEHGFSSCDS